MMHSHTLPVITVPISTPVCMYAARPENTCENPKIAPNNSAMVTAVDARGLRSPIVRHSPS